ncbi:MAG: hypothetical protein Q7K43_01155, partial [Candidatus Woesearchaeota archaeon]|nr:hypothetical protein [Candidatus Woesearchaeota archaeon]
KDRALTVTGASIIINSYGKPATNIIAKNTSILLRQNLPVTADDIVLIINMFTGEYELVRVANTSSRLSSQGVQEFVIQTAVSINKSYPAIQTQLVRVPQYSTVSIPLGTSLTAPVFDGTSGGIVALLANEAVTIQGSIDVSFKGFNGGAGSGQCDGSCPRVNLGIAGSGPTPGLGSSCATGLEGQGGRNAGSEGKLILGSGGGGGQCTSNAGAGGGIVLIFTNAITIDGSIRADGANGAGGTWQRSGSQNAYAAGGGAGGTVTLFAKTFAIDAGQLLAKGGIGGYDGNNQQFAGSGGPGIVEIDKIGLSCSPECLNGKIPDYQPNIIPQGCCGSNNECMYFSNSITSNSAANSILCTQTSNTTWNWLSQDKKGKTFASVCGTPTTILVSNTYYSCANTLAPAGTNALTITNTSAFYNAVNQETVNQTTVPSHDYACYDFAGLARIAECRGNEPGFSDSERFAVGKSITRVHNYSNQTFYCSAHNRWTADLDNADQETCALAGYIWTGSKCCTDQVNETYNEPNKLPNQVPSWQNPVLSERIGNTTPIIGGCWKSRYVPLGQYVTENNTTRQTILNYQGRFYACNEENTAFLSIKDMHTQQLVISQPASSLSQTCATLQNARPGAQQPHAYCTSQGWLFDTNLRNTRTTIVWPVPEVIPQGFSTGGCCTNTNCWNGTSCIQDQTGQSNTLNTYPGNRRCINGQWIVQEPKITFNGNGQGFCPQQTQCLFDPQGNPANNGNLQQLNNARSQDRPQCLNASQYFLDNYCDRGSWTSRTRLLATQLLSQALQTSPTNYTLYCDTPQRVIPWLDELSGAQTYFTTPCTNSEPCSNNICILTTPTQKAFGTTLNIQSQQNQNNHAQEIRRVVQRLSIALDIPLPSSSVLTFCENIAGNNQNIINQNFISCGEGFWYNAALQGIIYLPQETGNLRPLDITAQEIINQSLKLIIAIAQTHTTVLRPFDKLYPTTSMLSSLYITRHGNAFFFSFVEPMQRRPAGTGMFQDWLGVYAAGITHNVCAEQPAGSIRQYDSQAVCSYNPATQTTIILRNQQAQPQDTSPSALINDYQNIAGKLRP